MGKPTYFCWQPKLKKCGIKQSNQQNKYKKIIIMTHAHKNIFN